MRTSAGPGADEASSAVFLHRAPPLFRVFGALPHGLLVVVKLAQALMIRRVNEQIPVATVRDDVVNDRRPCAVSWVARWVLPCTFPAERLTQELFRPEFIRPDGQQIKPVVLCRGSSAILGLVRWTPTVTGQGGTSGMLTGSQRLLAHGLSPPNAKSRSRRHTHCVIIGSGLNSTGHGLYPRCSLPCISGRTPQHWRRSYQVGSS